MPGNLKYPAELNTLSIELSVIQILRNHCKRLTHLTHKSLLDLNIISFAFIILIFSYYYFPFAWTSLTVTQVSHFVIFTHVSLRCLIGVETHQSVDGARYVVVVRLVVSHPGALDAAVG